MAAKHRQTDRQTDRQTGRTHTHTHSGPHVSKDVSMCFVAIEHTSCYQAKTLTNHCKIKSTRKGLVPKPMVRLTQIYFHWVMGLGVV